MFPLFSIQSFSQYFTIRPFLFCQAEAMGLTRWFPKPMRFTTPMPPLRPSMEWNTLGSHRLSLLQSLDINGVRQSNLFQFLWNPVDHKNIKRTSGFESAAMSLIYFVFFGHSVWGPGCVSPLVPCVEGLLRWGSQSISAKLFFIAK